MTRGDQSHIGIAPSTTLGRTAISILIAELFQGFFAKLKELSELHGYYFYNIGENLSRKKLPDRWHLILKDWMKERHLTLEEMADALGYKKTGKGQPKGNVSKLINGRTAFNESTIRLWVQACGKTMIDFYAEALRVDAGHMLLEKESLSEKTE